MWLIDVGAVRGHAAGLLPLPFPEKRDAPHLSKQRAGRMFDRLPATFLKRKVHPLPIAKPGRGPPRFPQQDAALTLKTP